MLDTEKLTNENNDIYDDFSLESILAEYAAFDAGRRFGVEIKPAAGNSPCRCGDVITGRIRPAECPMFERVCTPDDPLGPCMVSSEGACAAAYKYME